MKRHIVFGVLILLVAGVIAYAGDRGRWDELSQMFQTTTWKSGNVVVTDGTNESRVTPDSVVTGIIVADTSAISYTIAQAVLQADTLRAYNDAQITVDETLVVDSTATFAQAVTFQGKTTLGNAATDTVTFVTTAIDLATGAVTKFGLGATDTVSITGPVGIGTTGPGYALDVNGGIRAGGAGYYSPIDNLNIYSGVTKVIYAGSGSMTIGSADWGGTIDFVGTGGTVMRIQANNGNVGIGTATPYAVLSVANATPTFALYDSDLEHPISFATIDSAAVTVDVNAGAGRINVYGSDADTYNISINTSDQALFTGASGGYSFDDDLIIAGTLVDLADADVTVFGGAATDSVSFTGPVGIGTATPGALLDIESAASTNAELHLNAPTVDWPVIFKMYSGSNLWQISHQSNQSDGALSFYDGTAVRMSIGRDGDVGIGTETPDRLFHSEKASALTNTVQQVARLSHITSGTPAPSIGLGLEFEQETSADNNEIIATIEAIVTDITATSEDADLVFKTMAAGAAAAERMRIASTGTVTFANDIDVVDNITAGDIIIDEAAGVLDFTGATSATISASGKGVVTIAAGDTLDVDVLASSTDMMIDATSSVSIKDSVNISTTNQNGLTFGSLGTATIGIDFSNSGLSGSSDYLYYFDSNNYHKANGVAVVGNYLYAVSSLQSPLLTAPFSAVDITISPGAGADITLDVDNATEEVRMGDTGTAGEYVSVDSVGTLTSSNTGIILDNTGSSVNSPSISLKGDAGGVEEEFEMHLVQGADPYLRISVDDDNVGPVLTAVLDIHDTILAFATDNTVDIGGAADNRPKDIHVAGSIGLGDDLRLADAGVVGIEGNEIITFNAAGTINFSGASVDIDGAFTASSVTSDANVTATTYVSGADVRIPSAAPGTPAIGSMYISNGAGADTLFVHDGTAFRYTILTQ